MPAFAALLALAAAGVAAAGEQDVADEALSRARALVEETFGKGAFNAGVIALTKPDPSVPRNAVIVHTDPNPSGSTPRVNHYLALLKKTGSEVRCFVLTNPHAPWEGCPVQSDPLRYRLWKADVPVDDFRKAWLVIEALCSVRLNLDGAEEVPRLLEYHRLKLERSAFGGTLPYSPVFQRNRAAEYAAETSVTRHVDAYLEKFISGLEFSPVEAEQEVDDVFAAIAAPVIVDPFPLQELRGNMVFEAATELCSAKGFEGMRRLRDLEDSRVAAIRWRREKTAGLPLVGPLFKAKELTDLPLSRRNLGQDWSPWSYIPLAARRDLAERGPTSIAAWLSGEETNLPPLLDRFGARVWGTDHLLRHDTALFRQTMERLLSPDAPLHKRAANLLVFDYFGDGVPHEVLARLFETEKNPFLKALIAVLDVPTTGWPACVERLSSLKLKPSSWEEAHILEKVLQRIRLAAETEDLRALAGFLRDVVALAKDPPEKSADSFYDSACLAINALSAIDRESNEQFLLDLCADKETSWWLRNACVHGISSARDAEAMARAISPFPAPPGGPYSSDHRDPYHGYYDCWSNLMSKMLALGDSQTLAFLESLDEDVANDWLLRMDKARTILKLKMKLEAEKPDGALIEVVARYLDKPKVKSETWVGSDELSGLLSAAYNIDQLRAFLAEPEFRSAWPAVLRAILQMTEPPSRYFDRPGVWHEVWVLYEGRNPYLYRY